MLSKQIDPRIPTLKRWIDLNRRFPGESTLRMMEYELLTELSLKGDVLDLGGGENSKYRAKLPADISYRSINIDPDIKPTWLVEPGKTLPIEDDQFDFCISLNTLEHVYDPAFLVREVFRLLKPGGTVHITVPWMFRIHGHPDDFTRATPSWWQHTLGDAGFSSAAITPLVWGRSSTAASVVGMRGLLKGLQKHYIHIKDCLYAAIIFGKAGAYSGKRGQRVCNSAPGHFITAVK